MVVVGCGVMIGCLIGLLLICCDFNVMVILIYMGMVDMLCYLWEVDVIVVVVGVKYFICVEDVKLGVVVFDVGVMREIDFEMGKSLVFGDVVFEVVEVVGYFLLNLGGVGLMMVVLFMINVVEVVECFV